MWSVLFALSLVFGPLGAYPNVQHLLRALVRAVLFVMFYTDTLSLIAVYTINKAYVVADTIWYNNNPVIDLYDEVLSAITVHTVARTVDWPGIISVMLIIKTISFCSVCVSAIISSDQLTNLAFDVTVREFFIALYHTDTVGFVAACSAYTTYCVLYALAVNDAKSPIRILVYMACFTALLMG